MKLSKLFRRSKAGNKTRIHEGKRHEVVADDLTQNEAKKLAKELRQKTGKRHFIKNGDGGTMVLEGGKPKRKKRTATKPKTQSNASTPKTRKPTTRKPKKQKLNPTLKAWNELRSMQSAFCNGDTNKAAVDAAENAYVKEATKGRKQTAKSARGKADKLRKCKN